jgi:hypothetical protein
MPLKKGKNDGFAELQKEADEAGIELTKTDDGYVASFEAEGGEVEWGPGENARAVLDDALALAAMEDKPDVFTYEEDGMGGARVKVEGIRGNFDAPTFASAYAAAQEALEKSKAEVDKPKGRAKPKLAAVETDEPQAEILPPTKPNGERTPERILGDGDTLRRLGEGFNKLSETLKELADAMHRDEALIPFMGKEFSEDDPPAGKSRVRRERGK